MFFLVEQNPRRCMRTWRYNQTDQSPDGNARTYLGSMHMHDG